MIHSILDLHFHKKDGTPHWLDLLTEKGMQRSDLHPENLHLLGAMDVQALRTRPIRDFIPRALLHRLPEMILAETGGTTGTPCRRVYLPQEFEAAFVAPWRSSVKRFDFPLGGSWLFIGPSGPHIIAQAARAFARATDSLEPFAIDCDVRWVKQQKNGSMGHRLYMNHICRQAINIINQQEISVLFTTPPLLLEVGAQMSEEERNAIGGIHTGGMAQDIETTRTLQGMFPNAVILPGYGNSLFGVCFEREQKAGSLSTFFPQDKTLHLRLIPLPKSENAPPSLTETVSAGERGRLMFHRFDASFLLLNMLERDTAIYAPDGETLGLSEIAGLVFDDKGPQGVY